MPKIICSDINGTTVAEFRVVAANQREADAKARQRIEKLKPEIRQQVSSFAIYI